MRRRAASSRSQHVNGLPEERRKETPPCALARTPPIANSNIPMGIDGPRTSPSNGNVSREDMDLFASSRKNEQSPRRDRGFFGAPGEESIGPVPDECRWSTTARAGAASTLREDALLPSWRLDLGAASAASAARRCESRKFELPPSTMMFAVFEQAQQGLERVLGRGRRPGSSARPPGAAGGSPPGPRASLPCARVRARVRPRRCARARAAAPSCSRPSVLARPCQGSCDVLHRMRATGRPRSFKAA